MTAAGISGIAMECFMFSCFQLQQIVTRPIQVFIDTRQLKICATCFEIAVGLLRTLELLVSLAPELVTDFSRPSAELLLCRLCQVSQREIQGENRRREMLDNMRLYYVIKRE